MGTIVTPIWAVLIEIWTNRQLKKLAGHIQYDFTAQTTVTLATDLPNESKPDAIADFECVHIRTDLLNQADAFVAQCDIVMEHVLVCSTDTRVRNINKDLVGTYLLSDSLESRLPAFAASINIECY